MRKPGDFRRRLLLTLGLVLAVLAQAQPLLHAGMGKAEMKVFYPGVGMYGYGKAGNSVSSQSTPLFARAMVVVDPSTRDRLLFVNCELAFPFQAIKDTVLARLDGLFPGEFTEGNTMITCTHTHAAPGGFSTHAIFNITTGGFHCGVFNGIVDGIVEASAQARRSIAPAELRYGSVEFPPDAGVAFNRSLDAFNANAEHVKEPDRYDTRTAFDSVMRGLVITRSYGTPIGFINWFGVHATCVDNNNTAISSDNKGYAAMRFEERNPGVVAMFAQEKAGDVSPNYHGPDKRRLRTSHRSRKKDHGHGHADRNGDAQAWQAQRFMDSPAFPRMKPMLDHEMVYVRMNDTIADPDFVGSGQGRTGDACYGLAFAKGTTMDGKGGPGALLELVYALSGGKHKDKADPLRQAQGSKEIFVQAAEGRLFGVKARCSWLGKLFMPDLARQSRHGGLERNAWVQQVLPVQIMRIGELAIIGLPTEITTTAGDRLASTVLGAMRPQGVEHVVIASYANTYAGYTTTPEEYALQRYEGGHTLFGQWQLPVFQSVFRKLANEMAEPDHAKRDLDRSIRPVFDSGELWQRLYPGSCTGH